jgi:hypothetical protein
MDHLKASPASGLYRTLLAVKVLSDKPVQDLELADIASEIERGDCSGEVVVRDAREISKRNMVRALQAQQSDLDFVPG